MLEYLFLDWSDDDEVAANIDDYNASDDLDTYDEIRWVVSCSMYH